MCSIILYFTNKINLLFLLISLLFYFAPGYSAALTFNDGMVHLIDYALQSENEHIYISDNINVPHNPTTVIFQNSHVHLAYADIYGCSKMKIVGAGVFSDISSYGHSTVDITNGSAFAGSASGFSKWKIKSGFVETIYLHDSARLTLMDGGVAELAMGPDTCTVIKGGHIHDYIVNHGNLNVYNGALHEIHAANGVTNIYGGTLDYLTFSGGDVTLYGSDFSMPLGTYTETDNITELAGVLSDGTLFDELKIWWQNGGTLTLVLSSDSVPEPNIILLLVPALLGLVRGYKSLQR